LDADRNQGDNLEEQATAALTLTRVQQAVDRLCGGADEDTGEGEIP